MAFFVLFICGFSKWVLNRRTSSCVIEPVGGGGEVAMAVEGGRADSGH
jgi:hypothetical protein